MIKKNKIWKFGDFLGVWRFELVREKEVLGFCIYNGYLEVYVYL